SRRLSMATRREGGEERKRGVPWTEEEHRAFLAGLANLGKGNWREISRSFVISRTPAQVASHAQKYFLRMLDKKKCRSSIFDVVISDLAPAPETPIFASSLNNLHDVKQETNHQLQDNHLAMTPSFIKIKAASQGAEASLARPLIDQDSREAASTFLFLPLIDPWNSRCNIKQISTWESPAI
ncbi:uncharacterized protein, partial [Elaeis guineensis]|uniref:uncharacterized protein n=1 Tax=Elaeis guineensis var. tenera TaxID=51953 RepID=UPI003C6DAF9D